MSDEKLSKQEVLRILASPDIGLVEMQRLLRKAGLLTPEVSFALRRPSKELAGSGDYGPQERLPVSRHV